MDSTHDLWKPVEMSEWRSTPHVTGRIAGEEDVKAGNAVFFAPANKNVPIDIGLPRCAIRVKYGTALVVIQSEKNSEGHWLGCRHVKGGRMIYEISEVQLLEGPDERFYSKG